MSTFSGKLYALHPEIIEGCESVYWVTGGEMNRLLDGVGLLSEPHFTSARSHGTVTRRGCYKLDESGNALRDAAGHTVMWPDTTWRGQ